jgi:TolA-binding protein
MENVEEELKLRIMDLEAELGAANTEIERLRFQSSQAQSDPNLNRDNEVYVLDRRATLSESKNRGEFELRI